MSSIWTKIAVLAVAVVAVIVVLGRFGGDKPASEPPAKEKTIYDMADRDKQFNEEPKPVEQPPTEQTQPAAAEAQKPPEQAPQQPAEPAQPPVAQVPPGIVLPSSITQPTTLYFKPLEEDDDIAAQQLLPYATTGRSLGRLPVVQYGLMVKACRQIEERWPDSWYAFRAKQLLEEISEQYAANYKITPQELDISRFLKTRRGAEPRTVEPVRR